MDIVKINIDQGPGIQTRITPTGWCHVKQLSMDYEQWRELGTVLMESRIIFKTTWQWALGDWWVGNKWGEGPMACHRIGVNYRTAMTCGYVARRIEYPRRRSDLSFAHHDAVCACGRTLQDYLLNWAAITKASTRTLRKKTRQVKIPADNKHYRVLLNR